MTLGNDGVEIKGGQVILSFNSMHAYNVCNGSGFWSEFTTANISTPVTVTRANMVFAACIGNMPDKFTEQQLMAHFQKKGFPVNFVKKLWAGSTACKIKIEVPSRKALIQLAEPDALKNLFGLRRTYEVVQYEDRREGRCWRCSRFGHNQYNCIQGLRCKRCGETGHEATPFNGTTCAKDSHCGNCGGNHEADDPTCPMLKKWLEDMKAHRERGKNRRGQTQTGPRGFDRQQQPRAGDHLNLGDYLPTGNAWGNTQPQQGPDHQTRQTPMDESHHGFNFDLDSDIHFPQQNQNLNTGTQQGQPNNNTGGRRRGRSPSPAYGQNQRNIRLEQKVDKVETDISQIKTQFADLANKMNQILSSFNSDKTGRSTFASDPTATCASNPPLRADQRAPQGYNVLLLPSVGDPTAPPKPSETITVPLPPTQPPPPDANLIRYTENMPKGIHDNSKRAGIPQQLLNAKQRKSLDIEAASAKPILKPSYIRFHKPNMAKAGLYTTNNLVIIPKSCCTITEKAPCLPPPKMQHDLIEVSEEDREQDQQATMKLLQDLRGTASAPQHNASS